MPPAENSPHCVGVDAHIDPLGTIEFAGDFRKIGFICRGDVGIAPYALFVNPHKFVACAGCQDLWF